MASGHITSRQIYGETVETMTNFIFLDSKNTAVGDYSQEIKRHLLPGRKAMTNLDSILKSRDITLLTKAHLVKAMFFPVILYGCESWTIKKAVVVSSLSLSHVRLFVTPHTATCQASLSNTNSQSMLKFMSIESVMTSNHLILCRPLYLCLQSFLESGSFPISQLFASGGQSIGASASVLPMNIQD